MRVAFDNFIMYYFLSLSSRGVRYCFCYFATWGPTSRPHTPLIVPLAPPHRAYCQPLEAHPKPIPALAPLPFVPCIYLLLPCLFTSLPCVLDQGTDHDVVDHLLRRQRLTAKRHLGPGNEAERMENWTWVVDDIRKRRYQRIAYSLNSSPAEEVVYGVPLIRLPVDDSEHRVDKHLPAQRAG